MGFFESTSIFTVSSRFDDDDLSAFDLSAVADLLFADDDFFFSSPLEPESDELPESADLERSDDRLELESELLLRFDFGIIFRWIFPFFRLIP